MAKGKKGRKLPAPGSKPKGTAPVGRPSSYDAEIASKILGEIATTTHSLRTICAQEGMPDAATVYRWLIDNKEFCDQYAHAKEQQGQLIFEETQEIADTPQIGVITIEGPRGTGVKTADMIEHRKLRVDTRKWMLSKLLPKKYGDLHRVHTSGPDDGPIQVKVGAESLADLAAEIMRERARE